MRVTPRLISRFASKVKFNPSGGCWEWLGAKNDRGYGQLWVGRTRLAHRLAYEFIVGAIEPGLQLDHVCQNPGCVNPDHLRQVTNKQNQEHRRGAQSNSTTGIRGVSYRPSDRRYEAHVGHNGKRLRKSFKTMDEAYAQVLAWRRELFTHDDGEVLS